MKMSKNMPKTNDKKFCPRTMIRYDNTVCGYESIWVCKMCKKSLLSEKAVKMHLKICSTSVQPPTTKKDEIYDVPTYICKFCNKVFSRHVSLKRHLENHSLSSSEDSDSDQF